jgi:hypothetical protein
MTWNGLLILSLLVLLGALQIVCWLLARGLGKRLERHVAAVAIGLPLVVLSPWLVTPRLLFPGDFLRDFIPEAPKVAASDDHKLQNDVVFQLIPWELEVRHALKARHLPFWSDLLEGGSSPWVNPQAGVLSPLALATRLVPIQHWLLTMLALKLQVAFVGTWLLARSLGMRRPASLLTALGVSLGGGVMAWALFPLAATIVWVPWLITGVIGLFRERPDSRRIATVGVVTAALLLSGHPETAAIGGLLAAVCGVSLRARRRSLRSGLGGAALAALLGFGLAAPLLVPFAVNLPQTQRSQETAIQTLGAHDVKLADPATWFLPASRAFLRSPLNPHVFGRPYQDEFTGPFSWPDANSGYAGLVALSGALLAAVCLRLRRAWPFLGFAVCGFLLVAELAPFAALLHSSDLLQLMCSRRFLGVSTLALTIAGGLGIDHLLRRRKGWLLPLSVLLIVALLSLNSHPDPHVMAIWSVIAVAVALTVWRPRWGAAALGAALLLDLVPWAQSVLPSGNPALFYPTTPLLAQLEREASQSVSQAGPWRAVGEDFALYPSLLPVYGVAEIRPHNPLAPMTYLQELDAATGFRPSMWLYFAPFENAGHPFLDFLNVCCIVWESPHPVPPGLRRIDDGTSSRRLFWNEGALPRWFVPSRIDVIQPKDLTAWIKALDDGRRVALFTDQKDRAIPQPPPAEIRAVRNEYGSIDLDVTAPQETVIATSLQMPEGWSVRSAGRPLQKLVVNGAFLGLRLPPGEQRVELRFVPPGFYAGAVLGGLSLLVCGALLLRPARLRASRR